MRINPTTPIALSVSAVGRYVGYVAVSVLLMPRPNVSLQVPPPHQHLAAQVASIGRLAIPVESHVFVQIARVSKRPQAEFAL